MNKIQKERYNRNIIIKDIGLCGQEKLLNSKILVCGAGGLASSVIVNLASMGAGNIGIIDDDNVELSNLNRQFIHKSSSLGQAKADSAGDWIASFNDEIKTEIFKIRLNNKNYKDIVLKYDIIVDCFDSFKSKFLLNDIALDTGKTLIHGGVNEFFGQVMTVIPKKSACLRCVFPETECEYNIKGVVSPAVSVIGSIQSMEVLKLILNKDNLLINKMLVFDGLRMNFKTLNIERSKNCKCFS